MTIISRCRTAGAVAPLLLLGGCLGGLIGGGKPAALYRFGDLTDVPQPAEQVAPRRTVRIMPIDFAAAAAGDRVLTIEGSEAAYLKNVRWVSPAAALFRDGLANGVARRAPDLVMATEGPAARHADVILSVSVTRFEASYDHGGKAAPFAHVAATASIIDPSTRTIVERRRFEHTAAAEANTVTSIVQSINVASRDVIVDLVDWVSSTSPVRRPRQPGAASNPAGTSAATMR